MLKSYLISVLFLLFTFSIAAQPLGNEWINYNQSYFKFPIVKNGIYRISYSELQRAGVPLQSVNSPRNFQVFGRGQEVPIYVHNEQTEVFGNSDYIEFYAQRNDGWYDSVLYKSKDHQPNTDYSFFTDTAYYYLTWNNTVTNKRLKLSNDVNYSAYTPANYFIYDSRLYFNAFYCEGEVIRVSSSSHSSDPEYVNGEGWYARPITTSATYKVPTKNVYEAGPQSRVYFEVMGASNYASGSRPNHHTRIEFAGGSVDSLYSGYTRLIFQESASNSKLGSTTTNFTFSVVDDINSGADRFMVPYVRVEYPHTPDLEGAKEFYLYVHDAVGQNRSYFNFTNFNGGSNAILYDLDNHTKIKVSASSSEYQVLIPNTGGAKRCFITAETNVHQVVDVAPVSSSAKFFNPVLINPGADYIIISHSSLMGGGGKYATATDYANYRNSKGSSTLLVDVEELYHQFSYGIRKNPMAIRNLVRALGDAYGYEQFKGLFLIGKSYKSGRPDPNRVNDYYRKNKLLFDGTLVPTMGYPPSDIQMLSGLVDNLYQPAMPIGRLSAKSLDHVDLYLDKVRLYEDETMNPQEQWKKRILHFSGGSTASEQARISRHLNNYKNIAEDTAFGANVTTFYKTTSDPIQIDLTELIKRYVNEGVNLLTFYGHGAGVGFDISIDDPSEYSNYGKYPFLLANSCQSGDIFQYTETMDINSSEEFILIRDKGMIGYIASVSPAYDDMLNLYSTNFYKNFAAENYGETVGAVIKNTIKDLQTPSPRRKEICMSIGLHGDPLLRMNSPEKPDFMLDENSVFYTPKVVNTAVDSFNLNLVIVNRGRAVKDSVFVEIQRLYPSSDSVDNYFIQIPTPYFQDTLSIKMPVNRAYGVGDNRINISIDGISLISEFEEANNSLSTVLNIKSADLQPVYPPEFAIVSNTDLTLKASTYFPFSSSIDYVFELDTSIYFNSPIKISSKIQSTGGVIEWRPEEGLQEGEVYFWRVSVDSNAERSYNWRNSSFQVSSGLSGWSQANFFQFQGNEYQFTKFNAATRSYSFVNDVQILNASTGVFPNTSWLEIYLKINQTLVSQWTNIPYNVSGMMFFVFDDVSSDLWYSNYKGNGLGQYNNLHNSGKPEDHPKFDFPTVSTLGETDSVWFRRIADFIAQIPDGNKVLAMNFTSYKRTGQWPEYLHKAFDSIGSNYIRNIDMELPYILFGEKGALGSAHEKVGSSPDESLRLKDSLISKWNEGKVTSTLIGPSLKWSSLHWKQHSVESKASEDSVRLRLVGVKLDGTEDIIIEGLHPDSTDVLRLNDRMSALDYPYCKLECYMKDDSMHTPAYIDYWKVIYQPAAEVAIDPSSFLEFHSDTLMQGDSLELKIAYKNLSDGDMDSLLVKAWVKDATGRIYPQETRRIAPLLANTFMIDTIRVSTMNYVGQCFLFVEINPINPSTGVYDQLEINHDNNKGDIPFYVETDKENPLLDVTFDGIHILNGDIVSARPEILISLRDESKFKAINDTSLFKVCIKRTGEIDYKTIPFSGINSLLEFIPAELPDNSAQVIYRPELDDGEYQLLVYANDASQNKSGANGYKIDFVVVNKSTITQMMNWPNPFSDKTHFVFTITGSELPDYLKIQILTVTGKLVREIDMDELGPIHIGRNITEYAWDGRDDFGDQLANGVYLYRVVTRLKGESIEIRESGADQYFKENFGKMYLMR